MKKIIFPLILVLLIVGFVFSQRIYTRYFKLTASKDSVGASQIIGSDSMSIINTIGYMSGGLYLDIISNGDSIPNYYGLLYKPMRSRNTVISNIGGWRFADLSGDSGSTWACSVRFVDSLVNYQVRFYHLPLCTWIAFKGYFSNDDSVGAEVDNFSSAIYFKVNYQ